MDLEFKQTDPNNWTDDSSNMYNKCLHLCLCVCTFSVMSRSQESMLSAKRSSVLLPWLDPNTLWLAWNNWLQEGEDTKSTHRGHYYPFNIMVILYRMHQLAFEATLPLFITPLITEWLASPFYADWLQCGSLIERSGHSPSKCCAGNLSIRAETREKLSHTHKRNIAHSLILQTDILQLDLCITCKIWS